MKRTVTTFSPDEARIYLYLKKYVPHFLRLLDPTPGQLRRIEKRIEDRYAQVDRSLQTSHEFIAETTLIDLFWKVDERKIHSLQFLNYIEKTCETILRNVSPNVLPEIRTTLFQLIINFDENKSRYRSYVGELSVLSKLVAEESLHLIKVEYPMPNGKSADYAFKTQKGPILIEIENLDLKADKIETIEALDTIITYRTEKKLNDKFSNLPKNWKHSISLIQVVWADMPKLYRFKTYFEKRTKYENVVLQLMMVAQLFDKKKEIPIYAFMTAKEFMKLKDNVNSELSKE